MENQLQKNIDCIWEFVQGCNDTSSGDGCKGPKGEMGPQGPQGEPGKVGTFHINDQGDLIYTEPD